MKTVALLSLNDWLAPISEPPLFGNSLVRGQDDEQEGHGSSPSGKFCANQSALNRRNRKAHYSNHGGLLNHSTWL